MIPCTSSPSERAHLSNQVLPRSTRLKVGPGRYPARRVDTTTMRRPMAGAPTLPACECDCGVPGAERQVLMEAPSDEPWLRCVCPYCGPEVERPGDRRQCVTTVHPIVRAFTPGNLLLCEECRTACSRLMKRTKLAKKGHDENERTAETQAQATQKGNGSNKNQQGEQGRDLKETDEATAHTRSL